MHFNTMWLNLLMALVGEQFAHADKINGCILARRQSDDRISLWTRSLEGPHEAQIKAEMSSALKTILNIDGAIQYYTHAALQDQSKQHFGKKGAFTKSQSAYVTRGPRK